MTIERKDGPLVVIGAQAPLGTTTGITGVAGAPPYISGVGENPDAGPSMIAHGVALRDTRLRSRADGVDLVAGGYANQEFGFVSNAVLTLNFAPATKGSTGNIVPAAAPALGVPMTLATASTGIVVETAFNTPGFLNPIPAGALRIDARPAYTGYSSSSAIQGWTGAAAGRGIVLTSSATLAGTSFTVKGFDLYGFPQSETIVGPSSATTVNSRKCYKWIASITPTNTSANTAQFDTLDVFEFPLVAKLPFQTTIWWNNIQIVSGITVDTAGSVLGAAGHFMPADTTTPATLTTGTVRGAFSVPTSAANGTIRLQVIQYIQAADLVTLANLFGVTPV